MSLLLAGDSFLRDQSLLRDACDCMCTRQHAQINLREQKIKHAYRFYLPQLHV